MVLQRIDAQPATRQFLAAGHDFIKRRHRVSRPDLTRVLFVVIEILVAKAAVSAVAKFLWRIWIAAGAGSGTGTGMTTSGAGGIDTAPDGRRLHKIRPMGARGEARGAQGASTGGRGVGEVVEGTGFPVPLARRTPGRRKRVRRLGICLH